MNKVEKIILVDIGGVLFFYNIDMFFKEISELSDIDIRMIKKFHGPALEFFNKGLWSSKTFFNIYKEAFRLDISEEKFWQLWNGIWCPPNENLIQILRKLKEKSLARLFITSNINQVHLGFLKKNHPEVFELFEGRFVSCLLGTRKPERSFFQYVINAVKLPSESSQNLRIYLIDDNSENLLVASNFGILPLLYGPQSQKENIWIRGVLVLRLRIKII